MQGGGERAVVRGRADRAQAARDVQRGLDRAGELRVEGEPHGVAPFRISIERFTPAVTDSTA
jgi:hypothetical protein